MNDGEKSSVEENIIKLNKEGESFKNEFHENQQFRTWLIIIAITAAVIGLFLSWIFIQVFLFKKPTCCCFKTGCLSSRVSRRGDGVEICSLASLTDLPPSYSMLHIEADPPKYGELFQPLSSSRQTV